MNRSGSRINLEIVGQVAVVKLQNPPGNVIGRAMLEELDSCLDRVLIANDAKVIIITGSGRSFSQGVDILEISKITSAMEAKAASAFGQKLFLKIENSRKPVIAAINGFCLGAGLELAMSCHIRIASDRSVMGMPEGSLGLIPSFGGTKRLPAMVGRSRATRMILTGETIRATEALSIGLVDEVAPKEMLLESAHKLAAKLAARSSAPMAQALRSIAEGVHLNPAEAMEFESSCVMDLFNQHDIKADIMAFLNECDSVEAGEQPAIISQ